ncbi:MAG: [FeFe] hydrogenase H-cluster radical SAM maturase HydE [Oscillospiraceae bacterium]|nr:[FeFe] hydrogenase H-cluster radical SAM maturase HydE [Oscillospiraceae bacterium]
MNNIIEKLKKTQDLDDNELRQLLECQNTDDIEYLRKSAEMVRQEHYGKDVYIRGLIEISNFCKNNCYYCGIRAGNKNTDRYRLSSEQILDCCKNGYALGFRTFVLQGGEDAYYSDELLCSILTQIKNNFPDCAVTLSLGERSYESYKKLYDAGADRYLLRHETASPEHYSRLHPDSMSHENRLKCLYDLKKIGFQTGSGFMVGSPFQTTDNLIADLRFLQKLKPAMIGIGPFVSHHETPFADFENGTLELTLKLISILRLMFPKVLLPSTTALGTISPTGREKGILAGANVVMPNLSPVMFRKLYSLYDDKICTGEEAAECRNCLNNRMLSIGYNIVVSRGDIKE